MNVWDPHFLEPKCTTLMPFYKVYIVRSILIPDVDNLGSCYCVLLYSDVIMRAIVSQIPGVSTVYSIVCSGADQRKHQSSASLTFVTGFHWSPVNSPHKGPVTQKMYPFDDVIMERFVINSMWIHNCSSIILYLTYKGCWTDLSMTWHGT